VGSGIWTAVSSSNLLAPNAAGGEVMLNKILTALADNVATNLAVVTIPNAIHSFSLGVQVLGSLGDGDSTETSFWNIAVSRVTGANAKMVIGAKTGAAVTVGVSGNSAVTLSNTAVGGAVGAVNTFQLQAKIARSAGAATNHVLVCSAMCLNGFATGVTIA
jgi:hypothetical protein